MRARVYSVGARVYGVGARVYGVGARVYGVRARVYGVGARVYGSLVIIVSAQVLWVLTLDFRLELDNNRVAARGTSVKDLISK